MNEGIRITGEVRYRLLDETGNLKDERIVKNLVVTIGKNLLAQWLGQPTQSEPFAQMVALGTGTNAPTTADTGLQTELGTRVAGTLTSSLNVLQNLASFAPGINTGSITEAGLFNFSSGVLFARQTFGVITKGVGDTLEVTWQITFS